MLYLNQIFNGTLNIMANSLEGGMPDQSNEGKKKSLKELDLEVFEPKYGNLSPEQFAQILGGSETKAQYEVMLYADLTENPALAKQVYDILGDDGIKKVILAECINPHADEQTKERAVEGIRSGIGERLRELAK